jgi:hypothetical protein
MTLAPVAQERNSRNAVARLRFIEPQSYGESMMADDANGRRRDTTASFEAAIKYGLKFEEFGFMNAVAVFVKLAMTRIMSKLSGSGLRSAA